MTGSFQPVSTDIGAPTPVTPHPMPPSSPTARGTPKAGDPKPTGSSKTTPVTFTVEFRVSAGTNVAKFNLAALHKELVQQFASASSSPIEYFPTNANSNPPPPSFHDIQQFPRTDAAHRAFFHRKETILRNSRDHSIKITHSITSLDRIAELKKRILPFLQKHGIYLGGPALQKDETAVIAWCCGAHPDMTHKQTLADTLNDALQDLELSPEYRNEVRNLVGDPTEVPEVFLTKRTISHGEKARRVSSEVLAICCTSAHARLLKQLLMELPPETTPYDIVPMGFHNFASSDELREYLMLNNDITLNLRGLTVVHFHPSLWDHPMPLSSGFNGILKQYFTSSELLQYIEYTEASYRSGRFIFIVRNEHFSSVQEHLTDFFQNTLPDMVGPEYLRHFNQYPRLTFAAQGQALQRHCQSLRDKLKSAKHTPTSGPASQTSAWNQRPKLVFDLSSVEASTQINSLPPSDPQGALSVASPNQSLPEFASPPAATAPVVAPSAQKSMASTDLSTIVSHFESAMSRQEENHRQMLQFMAHSQTVQMEQTKMMTQLMNHLVQALPVPTTSTTPAKRSAPNPPDYDAPVPAFPDMPMTDPSAQHPQSSPAELRGPPNSRNDK